VLFPGLVGVGDDLLHGGSPPARIARALPVLEIGDQLIGEGVGDRALGVVGADDRGDVVA